MSPGGGTLHLSWDKLCCACLSQNRNVTGMACTHISLPIRVHCAAKCTINFLHLIQCCNPGTTLQKHFTMSVEQMLILLIPWTFFRVFSWDSKYGYLNDYTLSWDKMVFPRANVTSDCSLGNLYSSLAFCSTPLGEVCWSHNGYCILDASLTVAKH